MPSTGAAPAHIEMVDFIPSASAQKRVVELMEREKESVLSAAEKSELDYYLQLEHILRMAKARARLILSSAQQN